MSYGLKAIQPLDYPHILGYASARSTADDAIFDIWNGSAASARKWRLNLDGQVQHQDGSAAAPTLVSEDALTSGIYFVAATPEVACSISTAKVLSVVAAGIAVTGTLSASGDVAINTNKFTVAAATGNTLVAGTFTSTGAVSVDSTTDTTSGTTGSIHTDGGLGVAKALYVGTTSRLVGAVTCDSTVSGAFNGTIGATTPAAGSFTTGAFSGNVTVGDGSATIAMTLNGLAANERRINFQTAGSTRWRVQADGVAEGGSNAGSDFEIERYADAGTAIDVPFKITRSTGLVTMGNGISATTGAFSSTVGIGTASPGASLQINDAVAGVSGRVSGILSGGTGGGADALLGLYQASADAEPAKLRFFKNRNAALTSSTVVADDDEIGRISFHGYDGSDYNSDFAFISVFVDGTPGVNDAPGRLVFSTTADGASTPTTALTLDSAQAAAFTGAVTMSSTLEVTGNTTIGAATGTARQLLVEGVFGLEATNSTNQWVLYTNTDNTLRFNYNGAASDEFTMNDSGDLTILGDLTVSGTGPHAIGGATTDYYRLDLKGAFTSGGASTIAAQVGVSGVLTGAGGDTDWLVGMNIIPTIVTQTAAETIDVVASLRLYEPQITKNVTTINTAATLYIASAPTEGTANHALYVAAGTTYLAGALTTDGGLQTFGANDSGGAGFRLVLVPNV